MRPPQLQRQAAGFLSESSGGDSANRIFAAEHAGLPGGCFFEKITRPPQLQRQTGGFLLEVSDAKLGMQIYSSGTWRLPGGWNY